MVKTQLVRIVATSVIKPVDFSEWASPIVPILKRNRQVRIPGNFKQTVNSVLQIDMNLILNIDDLYSKILLKALFYDTGFEWPLFTGSSGQKVTKSNDDKYS